MNRIASSLYTLGTQDSTDLCKYAGVLPVSLVQTSSSSSSRRFFSGRFFLKVSELFEKTRVRLQMLQLLFVFLLLVFDFFVFHSEEN